MRSACQVYWTSSETSPGQLADTLECLLQPGPGHFPGLSKSPNVPDLEDLQLRCSSGVTIAGSRDDLQPVNFGWIGGTCCGLLR
ncbi:hypothetical protein WJX84_008930 [Apatococcus fuscideae]|uniref:Uncharacterized protein n=1 Tax=Apatococcus fuscideae TaxID=2026836 RepID=A0AAW1RIT1_9CHLO